VSDLVALRAVFPVWDATGHGTERYPHDLNGVVRVPREVAVPLLHNGGYVIYDPGIPPVQAPAAVTASVFTDSRYASAQE
jgi:hypothetical protein